ncbi:MAG: hypothetical protein ABIJ50_02670 [Pseudomonadota bacterium]
MKSLDELIDIFRALLNNCWIKIQIFKTDVEGEYLLNDWKQFNWELIVENNLFQRRDFYLEPYGEGADYYGDSSRILRPEALPTHTVCCHSENEVIDLLTGNMVTFSSEGLPLECFVAIRDGWYFEEPPFDCILIIKDRKQLVVRIKDINFKLLRL